MRFKITLGDWSCDGHGVSEDVLVEVNYDLGSMQDNYLINVEDFGFGLDDFAHEYEESTIPAEWYDRLVSAGMPSTDERYTDIVQLDKDTFVDVAMFLIGDGLLDFKWRRVQDDVPQLFGGGRGLRGPSGYHVSSGYGLFGY